MRWSSWLRRCGRALMMPADDPCVPEAGAVALECEAYLTGELVELRRARRQYVLPWEWTNLLAHGSEDALRTCAEANGLRSPPPVVAADGVWEAARSYTASRLLGLVGSGRSLADLQRRVLVPVELCMASDGRADWWRPSEWVMEIESALDSERRAPGGAVHRGSEREQTRH